MKKIKWLFLLLGSLIIIGEIAVAVIDTRRNVRGDEIKESATIASTIFGYERVALCEYQSWLKTGRYVCDRPIAFPARKHSNVWREDTFSWQHNGTNRLFWREIKDRKVAALVKVPLSRTISWVSPDFEVLVGVLFIVVFSIIQLGGLRVVKFMDRLVHARGAHWMFSGCYVLSLCIMGAVANRYHEINGDGLVEANSSTSVFLGFQRIRTCSKWYGDKDWTCQEPIVLPLKMDRFQAFDQFVEYDQGQFVSLKDKYRGKPYSFRAKVAVAVALEYETCFGLFLFLVGFVRAGLHRRLPRWLWSIKWKNHARNVWSFVSNDRTIGIAAFSVGCLFILAISATLQENRYHRQAFDGVAERRTVTSWVLNYDRIAPCYLSQFHGGGGRGYVCDKPLAFPKPWWQGWFSVKYWGENFFFRNELLMKDSHGPDSKKKWCALGPTAEMPDQNRGRALLVAVVNPFHEALLSVWLCLVGMYFLGKYKFRK